MACDRKLDTINASNGANHFNFLLGIYIFWQANVITMYLWLMLSALAIGIWYFCIEHRHWHKLLESTEGHLSFQQVFCVIVEYTVYLTWIEVQFNSLLYILLCYKWMLILDTSFVLYIVKKIWFYFMFKTFIDKKQCSRPWWQIFGFFNCFLSHGFLELKSMIWQIFSYLPQLDVQTSI